MAELSGASTVVLTLESSRRSDTLSMSRMSDANMLIRLSIPIMSERRTPPAPLLESSDDGRTPAVMVGFPNGIWLRCSTGSVDTLKRRQADIPSTMVERTKNNINIFIVICVCSVVQLRYVHGVGYSVEGSVF